MTIQELAINIALFFVVFYGGLLITSFLTKRFREEESEVEKEEKTKKKKK
jgi:hypothetical protein